MKPIKINFAIYMPSDTVIDAYFMILDHEKLKHMKAPELRKIYNETKTNTQTKQQRFSLHLIKMVANARKIELENE